MGVVGSEGEIAQHLSAGGDVRRAHAYAIRGADNAEKVFALEEAAELLEFAIRHAQSESKRNQLIGRLGKLHLHMRNYSKARPLLEERLNFVRRSGRAKLREFEARRDLLFVDVYSSTLTAKDSGTALKTLYEELVAAELNAPRLEAELLGALFWAAARSFNRSLAEETISRTQELHNRCDRPDVRCRTARSLGIYARYRGNLPEAEALLREGLEWAEVARDEIAKVDCFVGLTTILSRLPRSDLMNHVLTMALPLAEQHADPARTANILCNCANSFAHLGELGRAQELLDQARLTLATSGDVPDLSPSIAYNLGTVAYMRGNLTAAEAHWTEALRVADKGGLPPVRTECLAALGRLSLRRGRIRSARALAAEASSLARRGGFLVDEQCGLVELRALLKHAKGRKARALRGLGHAAERAKTRDMPLYFTAQLNRIKILITEGCIEDALAVKAEVCEVARPLRATWWVNQVEKACR
jgi:tetratricopeptide (TPR) repeat protein